MTAIVEYVTLNVFLLADVVELADTPDLGSGGATHASSSLVIRTN